MRKELFLSAIIALVTMFLFVGCAGKQVKSDSVAGDATKQGADTSGKKIGEGDLIGKVEETSALQDVRFDYDKYSIRNDAKEILERNAAWLKKNPKVKIQIEGHCDERGTNEYNLALGDKRAKSVKDYLISLGIDSGRVSTISFGEEKPLDTGHDEEAWAKNRRGHFVIISK